MEGMNTIPTESTTVPYHIGWDGNPMGYFYSASRVREVLNSTGFFDSDEVEEWDREIIVPFGTSYIDFISVLVAKQGWTIKAFYSGGRLYPARGASPAKLKEMNYSLFAKTRVRKSVAQKEASQKSSVTGQSIEGEPEEDKTEESGRRDR
jgi:hypothetical protein